MGDGTTSVTVLASELLRQADKLIEMRIHPQTIAAGWRRYELEKLECPENKLKLINKLTH